MAVMGINVLIVNPLITELVFFFSAIFR